MIIRKGEGISPAGRPRSLKKENFKMRVKINSRLMLGLDLSNSKFRMHKAFVKKEMNISGL
jgi:hypothetical protein